MPQSIIIPPHPSKPSSSASELQHTLNDLLEQYLNLLHRYHTLQQALGGHLSSGFLSLASANFSNSSSRFRFGRDFYDGRMRALRTVSISSPLDTNYGHHTFVLNPASTSAPSSTPLSAPPHPASTPLSENPLPASTPFPENPLPAPPPPAPPPISSNRDPLHWFGILVPPALRRAQGDFKSALEWNIMEMATTATEMRGVEIEVRRMRKKIRIWREREKEGEEGEEGGGAEEERG